MNDFSLATGNLETDKPIFVTGAAGFIGFHLCECLLSEGLRVVGYDSVNCYANAGMKRERLALLQKHNGFSFVEADLCTQVTLQEAYTQTDPDYVVHLAAQAGVRYSFENPDAYVRSNISGFLNLLEICKTRPPKHFLYASSSSVYGNLAEQTGKPCGETDPTDTPMSFYGVTKKAGEVMAGNYSRLFGIPATGLRFFTVYGEWGRSDMAIPSFARKMMAGEAITLYNNGNMSRDFTYVGDIISGVRRILARPPDGHDIYNIGAGQPQSLQTLVEALQEGLGVTADIRYDDLQPGDPLSSYADCSALEAAVGYRPQTTLREGIARFCDWYKGYFR